MGEAMPHRGRRIRLGYMSGNFGTNTLTKTHLLSVFGLHDAARFAGSVVRVPRRQG